MSEQFPPFRSAKPKGVASPAPQVPPLRVSAPVPDPPEAEAEAPVDPEIGRLRQMPTPIPVSVCTHCWGTDITTGLKIGDEIYIKVN